MENNVFNPHLQRTDPKKLAWLRQALKRIRNGTTLLDLAKEEGVTRQAISLRLYNNPLDHRRRELSSAYRSGAQKRSEEYKKAKLKPVKITCNACGVMFTCTPKKLHEYIPVTCGSIECLRLTTGQQKIIYDISIPTVIKMKREGMSWRRIARELGYDTENAAAAIMQRIDRYEVRYNIPKKECVVTRHVTKYSKAYRKKIALL